MKSNDDLWILAAFLGSICITAETVLRLIYGCIEQNANNAWIARYAKIITDIMGFTIFLFAILFFIQDVMLFHPNNSPFCHSYTLSHPGFTQITVDDGNKSYKGIMRKNDGEEPTPLIIFFIGNATNAAEMMYSMDTAGMWDSFLNYNLLIMDYPGYGLNVGTPTSDNIYREALITYDYAVNQPYVNGNEIIIGGVSIGTGPAVYLAANRRAKGLFLLAPYANGYDLCNNVLPIFRGPMRLLVRNKLLSEKYAASISVPTLLVATKNDETVPFSSSERLRAHFPAEPEFVVLSGVGHNGIMPNAKTLNSIKNFLISISK